MRVEEEGEGQFSESRGKEEPWYMEHEYMRSFQMGASRYSGHSLGFGFTSSACFLDFLFFLVYQIIHVS